MIFNKSIPEARLFKMPPTSFVYDIPLTDINRYHSAQLIKNASHCFLMPVVIIRTNLVGFEWDPSTAFGWRLRVVRFGSL